MSTPLKRGEVRYLGHRPELEANLYAARPADGMPPEPYGRILESASDLLAACECAANVALQNNLRHQFPEMVELLSAAIAKALRFRPITAL